MTVTLPLRDRYADSRTCLQCGGSLGLAAREITVRSTGTGQMAAVHEDCLDAWQRRGPSQSRITDGDGQ